MDIWERIAREREELLPHLIDEGVIEMRIGSLVEIRYIGKGQGIVKKGRIKDIHSDGSYDIYMDTPPYGIKFSVPGRIVHEVQVSAEFQSRMDDLLK